MKLISDILDNQLVDRNQTKIGKVDGLVLTLERGKPPVVSYIEIGSLTLARRIGRRAERLVRRLKRSWGRSRSRESYRVPWRKITDIGVDIELDLDVRETPLFDWQDWLRDTIIKRLPGG